MRISSVCLLLCLAVCARVEHTPFSNMGFNQKINLFGEEQTISFFEHGVDDYELYLFGTNYCYVFDGKGIVTKENAICSVWTVEDNVITLEEILNYDGDLKATEISLQREYLSPKLCPENKTNDKLCYELSDKEHKLLIKKDIKILTSDFDGFVSNDKTFEWDNLLCEPYLGDYVNGIQILHGEDSCFDNYFVFKNGKCKSIIYPDEVVIGQGGTADLSISEDSKCHLKNLFDKTDVTEKLCSSEKLDLVASIAYASNKAMIKDKKTLKCLFLDDTKKLSFGNIDKCKAWKIRKGKINIWEDSFNVTYSIWPPMLLKKLEKYKKPKNEEKYILNWTNIELKRLNNEGMQLLKTTKYRSDHQRSVTIDIKNGIEIDYSDQNIRYIDLSYSHKNHKINTFHAFIHVSHSYGKCFPGLAYKVNKCVRCEKGEYIFENKICMKCKKNRYVTLNNTCRDCPRTKRPNKDRNNCVCEDERQYSPDLESECESIEDGKVANSEKNDCYQCQNKSLARKTDIECKLCGDGEVSIHVAGLTDVKCFICGTGTIPNTAKSACICLENFESFDRITRTCRKCLIGYSSENGENCKVGWRIILIVALGLVALFAVLLLYVIVYFRKRKIEKQTKMLLAA